MRTTHTKYSVVALCPNEGYWNLITRIHRFSHSFVEKTKLRPEWNFSKLHHD